eukprot:766269-Hanusia_phi.AAC.1
MEVHGLVLSTISPVGSGELVNQYSAKFALRRRSNSYFPAWHIDSIPYTGKSFLESSYLRPVEL